MNLFAYGTLMDPAIMQNVCGERFQSRPASLSGYMRKKLRGEVYPGIIRQPDSSVEGQVYFDVSAQALYYLDEFEGSFYQRELVTAVFDDGSAMEVEAYVLSDSCASLLSNEDWNLQDFLSRDKPLFQDKYGGYERLV
jgi:gamma-glutamylcyclotransferase (GGCT)/AIG2-like uncharacterized protein YtfP